MCQLILLQNIRLSNEGAPLFTEKYQRAIYLLVVSAREFDSFIILDDQKREEVVDARSDNRGLNY